MDDAVRVRERDRLADAQEDRQALGDVPVRARHPAIEPVAAHALHRVEETAVRQLAEVVDRHDARVLEPGDDPRLVRFTRRAVEDLQRHLAIERRIARQVDDPHAAAPERGDDLVACAGEVRRPEHRRQAIDRRLGNHPVRPRSSASNSSSVAHWSRSASSTKRRNSRRAAASSLVTSIEERLWRRASSA